MFFQRWAKKKRLNGAVAVMRPNRGMVHLAVELLESRMVLSTVYALTPGNNLIRFDSATPDTVATVGTLNPGAGEKFVGIDFRPRTSELFGSTVTSGSANNSVVTTYKINPLTAQVTLVGATAALPGAGDVVAGYDFNPTVDRIRYVNGNNENARFNPNNGTLAGNDTDLTYFAPATGAIIASAYDRNFDRQNATTIPTTLFAIDRGSSSLARQGGLDSVPSPNGGLINQVATLGFTLSATNDGGFDIIPGAGGGLAFAALTDSVDGLTRLYTINLNGSAGVASRIGLIGVGTTEVLSIAVKEDSIFAVGADAGTVPIVRVYDAATTQEKFTILAYDFDFLGGVRVAVGDVTGDGVGDIITGAGTGGSAHVRVFNGLNGQLITGPLSSFFAYEGFSGGTSVAAGDVNGDGLDDVITGADANGHVKVFHGGSGTLLSSFFAYEGFFGAVNVASGDFDLDGDAEIVTGAASFASHVKVFDSSATLFTSAFLPGFDNSFYAYHGFAGGVKVAVGDVSGDGLLDIITGAETFGTSHVKAFSGTDGTTTVSFYSFPGFNGSVRVAAVDTNGDGRDDIVVSTGPGGQSRIRFFQGLTAEDIDEIFAFPGFTGGGFIGG